jgi:uncharacterized membrane protein
MRMMTWSDFYVTTATAAAALLGLLFVAVQFNLERLPADQSQQWLASARATFLVFATLFLVPLVSLVPGQLHGELVPWTAFILLVSGWRIVAAWLPARHSILGRKRTTLIHALWLVVGPLALYAALLGYTVAFARGSAPQFPIAYILIGLFGLALRNSWDLLVELRFAARAEDT